MAGTATTHRVPTHAHHECRMAEEVGNTEGVVQEANLGTNAKDPFGQSNRTAGQHDMSAAWYNPYTGFGADRDGLIPVSGVVCVKVRYGTITNL